MADEPQQINYDNLPDKIDYSKLPDQGTNEPPQRGLLSGLEDMYHGFISGAQNSANAMSSKQGLENFNKAQDTKVQNTIEHPLKTAAGLFGVNVDQLYNDYQNKNYSALAGDVLPNLLMMGGGALLHGAFGGESNIINPGMEVAPKTSTPIEATPGIESQAPESPIRGLLNPAPTRLALPAFGQTTPITNAPRFYAGKLGTADADVDYIKDFTDYIKHNAEGTGYNQDPETGSFLASLPPEVAAQFGLGKGEVSMPMSADVRRYGLPGQVTNQPRNIIGEESYIPPGGMSRNVNPEPTLAQPFGGRVINAPESQKELPFNSNQVDVVNKTLSSHSPEGLAKTFDSNPQTVGQRPIPDIVNSTPVNPVIPEDLTIPRAGQSQPVDAGKWAINLQTAPKILSRYESTKPIADAIMNAQDSKLPFINQTLQKLTPFLDSSANNQVIFNALDGKIDPASLDPQLQAKVSGIRQILDEIHAGLPGEVGKISDYITHMQNSSNPSQQTLWGYYFGKKPTYDPLQPGSPNAIGNTGSPYTITRTGELTDYSTDLSKVLRAYVSSIAKAKIDEPALDAAKKQLALIPDTLPRVHALADAYLRNYSGYDAEGQLATEFKNWSNAVANTYIRSYLDWNIPIHMLHLGEIPSSVFPELGSKYTAIGAAKFSSSPAAITREISSNGLIQNSVIPPAFQTIAEKYQTAANFWNVAESVTKGIAYAGAKQRALDNGMSPQQAVMKAIADTKDMTYTSDPARMVKGLTSQSNIAGGQVASRVGQTFKGVPLKILQQYDNIIRNTKGNIAQKARLMFGASLAAGGTMTGLHTFHMNPSNLLKPTVLGPLGDLITTVGRDLYNDDWAGAVGNTIAWAFPGGQQVKQLIK